MSSANSNIQVANPDFNTLKASLIQFLQSQTTLQDYNFAGSGLSVLMDLLAMNTQMKTFYLNMVANEMFLDTALQRSSVVSQAKPLGYTPKSAIAPTATVNITVSNVNTPQLIIPQYTRFVTSSINGVNYNFVSVDSEITNVSGNTAFFQNVDIKQGVPSQYSFTVNSLTNPNYIFEIPDANIDTSTLQVIVQQSSTNNSYQVFTLATNFLNLDGTDQVYFLQEALDGNYQIYFGDGIIGQQLVDGNIIQVNYISTSGSAAAGANNFGILGSIGGFSTIRVDPVTPATTGGAKESIASIKFSAPKAYSAQGRAVTKDDYITLIQQNQLGYSFDAVNVWGGEENVPPVYGQVFIAIKPSGAYTLTDTQKQDIITNIIKPISVLTVNPVIVDPDYTYLTVVENVTYDQTKTLNTLAQVQSACVSAISNFGVNSLNTFNSTFSATQLNNAVSLADPSIIANESTIQIQKKFYPNLKTSSTYTLSYGTPLQRGILSSGISSFPGIQYRNPSNPSIIIDGVFLEEVPSSIGGLSSISIVNPGFNYTTPPTVTILGDGSGATAAAILDSSGRISSIQVTNAGNNYTSAVVSITNAPNDTTGLNGSAIAVLEGQFGSLSIYYFDSRNVKTILKSNIGVIDYYNGIITLNSFSPVDIDNPLGQLAVTATPVTTMLSSTFNKIITIDPFDPNAITVNVTAKTK